MINNTDVSQYGFVLAFKRVETFVTTKALCHSRYNYANYSLISKRFSIFSLERLLKAGLLLQVATCNYLLFKKALEFCFPRKTL